MQKNKFIMVMHRLKKDKDAEWAMEKAFNVDTLGIEEAMSQANGFLKDGSRLWQNLEYKLQGGEW